LRTFSIKNPKMFARDAFIDALKKAGILLNLKTNTSASQSSTRSLTNLEPVAVWTSPPLSEYAKLILKVSHNPGADLIPLLLAVKAGKNTFEEGMVELGKFMTGVVKVLPDSFVFLDGAGGDQNRLTPQAEVKLLEYVKGLPAEQFKKFNQALPILGVDGNLTDVSKGSAAAGKVHAKPGTGISFNAATEEFFLTTKALAGYIEGQNGHLIEFMVVVNNGIMPKIVDIFPIFDDIGEMATVIYEQSKTSE
jgi:D-alanyl-D-alanine carboxypeptidase/D-alanyl-D-alanine-endopeptidase (penicillin-binding protein 4)